MSVTERQSTHCHTKVYSYPCGVVDIITSSNADFRIGGPLPKKRAPRAHEGPDKADKDKGKAKTPPKAENLTRAVNRARANVRRLALANEFAYFVTLTLDQRQVDRHDMAAITKKLNNWLSNQVRRRGLRYIIVPERHKDGAIHFHGFFNDALPVVDSGHKDDQGHPVYNLPSWTLGFTTAIRLYGDYPQAVAYVCKYIGKQGEKPGGRWYYSGGDLVEPEVSYGDLSVDELHELGVDNLWKYTVPGREIAGANGIRTEDLK